MRTIQEEVDQLRTGSLHRQLKTVTALPGGLLRWGTRELVNFSSNDYLGFSHSPELRAAFRDAVEQYGAGAGASRLISGSSEAHEELEAKLADFKGTEASLSYSTGYATAIGAITALVGKGDVVILDKLAHASLIDGARLSGADLRVFPHNRLEKLRSHLAWAHDRVGEQGRILIVTESIFSMDGDCAPLAEICALKDEAGAMLLVDEAHAVGVAGPGGRGLAQDLDVEVQMGTLSKALGVSGGYLCGSRELIELLVNRSRSLIYSTAPPPAVAATASAAVDLLRSEKGERRRKLLQDHIKQFQNAMGVPEDAAPQTSHSAIQPVVLGPETRALETAKMLERKGYFVPAIRYPTVARGSARLRVTLSASHEAEQIDGLTAILREIPRD